MKQVCFECGNDKFYFLEEGNSRCILCIECNRLYEIGEKND